MGPRGKSAPRSSNANHNSFTIPLRVTLPANSSNMRLTLLSLSAIMMVAMATVVKAQMPASRPLTPAELNAIQATEVEVEYEIREEFAQSLGLTVDELNTRAQAFWADATAFEYSRALANSDKAFPYLICRNVIDSSAAPDATNIISGRDHRLAIGAAIAAASEGVSPPASTDEIDPNFTVLSDDEMYCALSHLGGAVAMEVNCGDDDEETQIEVECIVQPVLFAMKLLPDTFQAIVASVVAFYSLNDPVDEDVPFVPNIPDDTAATTTGDEDVGGPGGAVPELEPTFPSLDIVLCPGVVDEDDIPELAAGTESGGAVVIDLQEAATQWLLGIGDNGQNISQSFYWTSDSASALLDEFGSPERSGLLRSVLDATIGTNLCADTFSNRLTWTGVFLPSIQGVHVEFINTDAEQIDEACALALTVSLAVMPEVCAVQVTPAKIPYNDRAQWLVQSFKEQDRPFFDAGIRGEGQIVAVSDTGVDVNNCYFSDADAPTPNTIPNAAHRKIVQYWDFVDDSDYQYGHGTHVSGTVLGKKSDGTGIADGVAPEAKLAFCDIGTKRGFLRVPPNDLLLETGRVDGMETIARIHSASWGAEINYYDYQARQFDDILYDWDDLLVNVAAGNSGRYNELNTVGTPAVAKNILSVGSSQSADDGETSGVTPRQGGQEYVSDFSSRGTTADGRIKPDVVAPGEMLLSAGARPDLSESCDELGSPVLGFSRGGLVWMAGTSMATPAVSGAAALVREYFEKGFYPGGEKGSGPSIMPSAATVKAVLMNGAQFMAGVDNPTALELDSSTNPYDVAQGFGRVSLLDSLHLAGRENIRTKVWDRQTIGNAQLLTRDVTVDASACDSTELRATLVWSEPGSSLGCRRCLLNDLDLFVIPVADPATVYYPNDLDKRDSTNNAERVIIPDTVTGETFKIFVEAHNLLGEEQVFSLVVTGCFDTDNAPPLEPIDDDAPGGSVGALPVDVGDEGKGGSIMNPSDIDVGIGTGEGSGEEKSTTSGAVTKIVRVFTTLLAGFVSCLLAVAAEGAT